MDNKIISIDEKKTPRSVAAGRRGGGDGFDVEKRVANLEVDMKDVKKSLQAIELLLTRIEGDLKSKALAVDLAEIKGKLSQIPNYWQQMGISLAIIGFAFTILKFVK